MASSDLDLDCLAVSSGYRKYWNFVLVSRYASSNSTWAKGVYTNLHPVSSYLSVSSVSLSMYTNDGWWPWSAQMWSTTWPKHWRTTGSSWNASCTIRGRPCCCPMHPSVAVSWCAPTNLQKLVTEAVTYPVQSAARNTTRVSQRCFMKLLACHRVRKWRGQ